MSLPDGSEDFFLRLDRLLTAEPLDWNQVLRAILTRVDCPLGTIHHLDARGELVLVAQIGLPPIVLAKVERIPIGKGMAGIAAQRRAPVQVCNLQTDASGVVRPGARDTKMEGSIACPMIDGERLAGVVGVAKPVPYEFSAQETDLLMEVGRRLARHGPSTD